MKEPVQEEPDKPFERGELQTSSIIERIEGRQSLLPGAKLSKKHQDMQNEIWKKKQDEKEEIYKKSFYVLDTETGGFTHNEPIQIAALRYENGKQVAKHNQYFYPLFDMTREAIETHYLSKGILA